MNPFLKEYNTDTSDDELIIKAQRGERKSLEELLLKHQPFVYNIAWKMVRNPDDAADLTQEALIKVTVNLGQFKFKSTFRTWAYRIVLNHFLAAKRKQGEIQINSFDVIKQGLDQTTDHPLNDAEQKIHEEYVREMNLMCMSGMLLCLNKEQRLIFIIGEMFNADHNIGSELMQMSKDNFRAKLKKARRDIFNFMNNHCGLVNKANSCRCHKKVKFALDNKHIDAKNLLHNRRDYANFRDYIREDSNQMIDYVDDKYAELYKGMTFKKDFDKKLFIQNILDDVQVRNRLNLS